MLLLYSDNETFINNYCFTYFILGEEKIIKHDKILKNLYNIIKSDYDEIYKNIVLYTKNKRGKLQTSAEIDIIGIKDKEVDVYEIKCAYHKCKAVKQLNRIENLLQDKNTISSLTIDDSFTINKFFYYDGSDEIEEIK